MNTLISAVELADLRSEVTGSLDKLATLVPAGTKVADGRGGWAITPGTPVPNVPCRVIVEKTISADTQSVVGGRQLVTDQMICLMAWDQDPMPGDEDRLIIDGGVFSVHVVNPVISYRVSTRFRMTEIKA